MSRAIGYNTFPSDALFILFTYDRMGGLDGVLLASIPITLNPAFLEGCRHTNFLLVPQGICLCPQAVLETKQKGNVPHGDSEP